MKAVANADAMALLCDLIEIPSLSSEEDRIASYLVENLSGIFGSQTLSRHGNNVVVTLGRTEASHRILLCSHIDTVGPADGWKRDPFKAFVEHEKIYGLGANDALGSLVSMIAAASRMQDKLNESVGITLALVAEEEKGEKGFFTLEPSLNYTSAIFGEPTDLRVGTAMRGYMRVKILGEGISCHASRPWEGRNAITDLVQQLYTISNFDMRDDSPWGQATMEVTLIAGGKNTNQIPDKAEATLDIRPTPSINNDKILDLLKKNGCRYEIVYNRRKPMACQESSEIFCAIKSAHPNAETYAFGGTCDMAFATKPSIVLGPGKSHRSHAADEHIEKKELVEGISFFERTLEHYNTLSV